ncbi:hypothetical protein TNCV_2062191 [Trichonephila clavipes]|nr:hypothetical protein TNCV_2062191 [Trichonephila clavipes]
MTTHARRAVIASDRHGRKSAFVCQWPSHRVNRDCTKHPQEAREGVSTRELLATDHVILNHGQVTLLTPELASPLLTTTPHQREDVSALDKFNDWEEEAFQLKCYPGAKGNDQE